MVLSPEDCQLFYRLFFSLLDYTNDTYHVANSPKMSGAEHVDTSLAYRIASYLWANTSIIDDYLVQATDLSRENVEIVYSWKRCLTGRFVVERHLKRGSVLIGDEGNVYLVSGIISHLEDLLPFTPAMVEMTLLPFRGRIIYDSLFHILSVHFGGGMKKSFKDEYMEAKKAGRIFSTL